MKVRIEPSRPAGRVNAPPSKSGAHRAVICAALAGGESRISNVAFSEDIGATAECVECLGCSVKTGDGKILIKGTCGVPRALRTLNCRESGSTLRFLLPVCLLSENETVLTGSEKLFSRPLGIYEEICEKQGLRFEKNKNMITVAGGLKSGIFELRGNVSSQFISGLLFALPLLERDSEIRIIPPFESRPYVELTLHMLHRFGIVTDFVNEYTLKIPGGQVYRPCDVTVEGDWSNAAYLYAFDGLEVTGTDPDSVQGDRVCLSYFEKLKNGFAELDLSDCPDLAPIMFAYAAAHNGGHFTGTDRLRLKESDRISSMEQELSKFGIVLKTGDNKITVCPGTLHAPEGELYGHNDHRIVMALSYLLSITGGTVTGAEAVAKSFPDYFDVIKKAGVEISYEA